MSGKRNLRRLILLFVLLCAIILLTVISVCAEAETQFGFVKTDDGWCYLDANGERVIGQCIIEDEYYVFDESGIAKTGFINREDYNNYWAIYTNGIWQQQKWKYFYSLGRSDWWYADDNGKLHDSLEGLASIRIPSKIDSLSARFFAGITRDFIIYCDPGSYAEKYALSVGLPYDNGKKHVIGTSITDVNEKANWIIKNYIKSGMTDRQKALVLHNWLIYNAHYDYTFSNYNASGVLIQGAGVCDSYSKAYCLLLSKVGIENKRITGIATNSAGEVGGHAWTLVKVDGQWYHVDCTWDDPGNSGDASVSGWEENGYFLVGDSFIKQSRTFDDESISADNNCVGWIEMGNETYYYGSDGKRAIGLTTIDNDTYFFNNDGIMLTGLQEIAGRTYYFSEYYGSMQTGWKYFDDESGYRYFNDNGEMLTGWYTEEDKTYYFFTNGLVASGLQEVDGAIYLFSLYNGMQKNTWWYEEGKGYYYLGADGKAATDFTVIDGNTFFFNEQHIQQTGWMQLNETAVGYMSAYRGLIVGQDLEIDGAVYRFDENGNLVGRVVSEGYYSSEQLLEVKAERDENGILQIVTTGKVLGIPLGWTGWVCQWGNWFYGDENGYALIGLHNIDGLPYCFNEQGELSIGWIKVNDKWYYADNSGIAAHNGWQEIGNVWYYFYADGEMATGWLNDGGTYYYLKNDGSMLTGWVKDKGKWYYLNDNGALKTGWLNDNGNWYYLLSDGHLAIGWICDGGAYYYMNKNGLMLTGWIEDDGKWYYMNESGVMQTGWLKSGSSWYYLCSSGELASGWQQINDQWYFFKKSGAMASSEWIEDNEAEAKMPSDQKRALWYWFDSNGKMAVGWKEIHGQWEMFSDSGEWLYTWDGN